MGEEGNKPEEKKKDEGNKTEDSKASEVKSKEGVKEGGGGGDGSASAEKKAGGEEGKAEAPPPPPPEEIVLRVYMHCEGCARKVKRSLKGFEGVDEVTTDCKTHKVVVKGKKAAEDPLKVMERVQKKSGRKVELLTPLPPPKSEKKEEVKQEDKPKQEEKKEELAVMFVVLKVHMHCEACAQEMKKRILKMKGVQEAEPDLKASQVTVKGIMDAAKLVEYVYKRTGKHAVVVKSEPADKKPEGSAALPADEKSKSEGGAEEKKAGDGGGGEKKAEGEKKGDDGGVADGEDKEKKELGPEDAAAGGGKLVELKKNDFYYYYPRYAAEFHAYPPPQLFSDENPNACSVM
ncbi:hypothetical protein HPP92_011214 [Vanilla planifolia]|uniref:HMA domain-containing protein n=1 Tax=Vanilla planifolia TaxID=51239 RepID=A0A835R0T1_VANPL|nr:hypothetical protein HPP92_011534 [Vanilla planifolia]KAG0483130.1 hypothetical protein HPP92_011214 [Vanilla planifolia]